MKKHIFSLYVWEGQFKKGLPFILADAALVHRIVHVLRLEVGEELVLFNDQQWAVVVIKEHNKKQLTCMVLDVSLVHGIEPRIVWFLSILEREDFEHALTMLTVYGVNTIIPFISQKSRRAWGSAKDLDRAKRVMVAAAEQSKQYALPKIEPVLRFEQIVALTQQYHTILFEFGGEKPVAVIQRLAELKLQDQNLMIACLVGPEGGFGEQEEAVLRAQAAQICTLVSMTLKACDAVSLSAGLIRSMVCAI